MSEAYFLLNTLILWIILITPRNKIIQKLCVVFLTKILKSLKCAPVCAFCSQQQPLKAPCHLQWTLNVTLALSASVSHIFFLFSVFSTDKFIYLFSIKVTFQEQIWQLLPFSNKDNGGRVTAIVNYDVEILIFFFFPFIIWISTNLMQCITKYRTATSKSKFFL